MHLTIDLVSLAVPDGERPALPLDLHGMVASAGEPAGLHHGWLGAGSRASRPGHKYSAEPEFGLVTIGSADRHIGSTAVAKLGGQIGG